MADPVVLTPALPAEPPKPAGGTALQAALPVVTAAAVAAAKAATPFGTMQLMELLSKAGITTLVCLALVFVYRDLRADQAYSRDQDSKRDITLISAIQDLQAESRAGRDESRANRLAIEELTREVRFNRK